MFWDLVFDGLFFLCLFSCDCVVLVFLVLLLGVLPVLRVVGVSVLVVASARLFVLIRPGVFLGVARLAFRLVVWLAWLGVGGFFLVGLGALLVQFAVDFFGGFSSFALCVSGASCGVSGHLCLVALLWLGRASVLLVVWGLHRSLARLELCLIVVGVRFGAAFGAAALVSVVRVQVSSWVGGFLVSTVRFVWAFFGLGLRVFVFAVGFALTRFS
ncbi:hypothetical protein SAMN05216466_103276 [Paraburkholderia phenazinium]|uniref:Uncharacterized protein n=1 Tax=Paraburkholderia phenazinium TaxID=60549 RepID=A0A1G7U567_9BURK|nr:hypothetical protein [Paraburkholderia phenazinium]SDG41900.1 hypothetical protein SAMN05216466_103276 [Paraburkholderia phenazinium]